MVKISRDLIPDREKLRKESAYLYTVLNDESDLACALIAVSFLDNAIASRLKAYFIDSSIVPMLLNPPSGILSTFSSRYNLAYCVGLVSKNMRQNLEIIGSIRNEFAHSFEKRVFESDRIAELIKQISIFEEDIQPIPDIPGEYVSKVEGIFTIPRNKFIVAVILIFNRMIDSNNEFVRCSRLPDEPLLSNPAS